MTKPTSALHPSPSGALVADADLYDAVRIRRSIRTFDPTPLRQEHLEIIRTFLDDPARTTGPFGHRVRIDLLNDVGSGDHAIGTYGYIVGYSSVIAGVARNEPLSLFELAYVFHTLVLQLTNLGLGTVWIGGGLQALGGSPLHPHRAGRAGRRDLPGGPPEGQTPPRASHARRPPRRPPKAH